MELRIKIRSALIQVREAVVFHDLIIIDEAIVEIVVLIVVVCMLLFGLLRLAGLAFTCLFVLLLVVFSFFCRGSLVTPVLLDGRKIALYLDACKHRLDKVLESVAANVTVGFGVIIIVSQVFTLNIAFVASFLDIIRFFIVGLFFEQLGLLGLNSK